MSKYAFKTETCTFSSDLYAAWVGIKRQCLAVWNSSRYKYRVVSNIIPKVKDKNKKFLKVTQSRWRFKDVPGLSSLKLSFSKSFICV